MSSSLTHNPIYITWTELKVRALSHNREIQYVERPDAYVIFISDNTTLYNVMIFKSGCEPTGVDVSQNTIDRTDFETNYQPTANAKTYISVKAVLEAGGAPQNVIITDPINNNLQAAVDASGRLLVSTQPPTPPAESTPIIVTAFSSLGNNAAQNTYYTITNGDTLYLQRFEAAGEAASGGWFVYLFEDPNGAGNATSAIQPSWVLISLIVINEFGDSKFVDLTPSKLIGDGTRRVVVRRERKDGGGAKQGFIKFSGYEE